MTQKEMKRLSRADLLEMLIEQGSELEAVREKLAAAEEQLRERELKIAQAGSIAEAALQLNNVFAAAEAAAQQYLENVRGKAGEPGFVYEQPKIPVPEKPVAEEKPQEPEAEPENPPKQSNLNPDAQRVKMMAETQLKCKLLQEETEQRCRQMETEAKLQAEQIVSKAKQEADDYWKQTTEKLEAFYQQRQELRDLMTMITDKK